MTDPVPHMPEWRAIRAWPFEEAARVADRLAARPKAEALFETGYGPSGLPHIGTFGEVVRTTMVRNAFTRLSGVPSRLVAFSDDMDGLRKVPDNVPNREMLAAHLGRPLTVVPDPFGTHPSFGAHNNARLRAFLDQFGFDYDFASSTDYYRSGRFDTALLRVLERYDEVIAVILPTLGEERRATYSPFLPISPRTGQVLQVPVLERKLDAGTIVWRDEETGALVETPVTGGHCKLQWKCDWAMRWFALGVDYEMSGKDLIDSVRLSSRICRILGAEPPESFTYELFLDEKGEKISKSKGNGLSVEQWLEYAPPESLAQFMFNKPQAAKRLYFDAIPRAVDEYLANLEKARTEAEPAVGANPAWHIHGGHVPNDGGSPLSYAMLLNLASVVNAETPAIMWGFIRRYRPDATPEAMPMLGVLVARAVAYYRDFVRPTKQFRDATEIEAAALADLADLLAAMPEGADAAALQDVVFEAGKRHYPKEKLRDWFGALYQVLLGQQEGPRFGGFVALYGVAETVALIRGALARAILPHPGAARPSVA
jgi:lysyl-tRNA synthetase class 1